ncbi:hypothetical protein ACLKA7_002357 [Drosophila subpalustris]
MSIHKFGYSFPSRQEDPFNILEITAVQKYLKFENNYIILIVNYGVARGISWSMRRGLSEHRPYDLHNGFL